MRATTLLATLAMLVLSAAPAAAGSPDDYISVDGVTYYIAHGTGDSGNMALGDAIGGAPSLAFSGCALAQLRPERDHGRVRMLALVENTTLLGVDISKFEGPEDGMATNLTVDGSAENGHATYPAVRAAAAAWGRAHITINGLDFVDPAGSGTNYTAAFFVSDDGFRNDATKRIEAPGGALFDPTHPAAAVTQKGQSEFHLRVESLSPGQGTQATVAFSNPGTAPDGSTGYAPEYTDLHGWTNTRFGGHATVHITATAPAPAGSNELHFQFSAGNGDIVGNTTLAPALLADASGAVSFPMEHFGTYHMRVTGKALLAKYTVTITMDPPEKLDLNFWWDHVVTGKAGRSAMNPCILNLGGATEATAVGREVPPTYPVQAVLIAIAGSVAAVLVVAKLVMITRSNASFKRSRGGS